MHFRVFMILSGFCLIALPVQAQTDSPTPPSDLPAPPPVASEATPAAQPKLEPPAGDLSIDEWKRDDWMLVKPSVSLLEINGYFRVRGDILRKLDFNNAAGLERVRLTTGDSNELVPRYDKKLTGAASYTSTNMRLRIEPQINVSDRIQIITTLDVLDNITLGSTPDTLPPMAGGTPVNVLSRSQNPPRQGINALTDSLVIKRAYVRLTALNEQLELKVGRMANHWGLGMMTNNGDCLDCDYGDVVDRLAVTFKAANHLFTPMYDWVSTGPVITPFGRSGGQPIDAVDRDDAGQYSVRIERLDHPEDARALVSHGQTVVNYGIWNMIRTQKRDLDNTYYNPDAFDSVMPPSEKLAKIENRSAFVYTLNSYGRVMFGAFNLAAEGAFMWGSFKDKVVDPKAVDPQKTQIYKIGGALEGSWQMPGQRLGSTVCLKAGGASGDSMPGYGTLDRADTQRGTNGPRLDRDLNNFQFSPDYHVDLLMFRRIIGTVTDAWYVRPSVTYLFDDNFAGSLATIYSQAIFKNSTPGKSLPMGLELDAEITYGLSSPNAGPFGASLAGGLAFPFGAFDMPLLDSGKQGGSFAWTLQSRIFLTF